MPESDLKIVQFYENGLSIRNISKETGVSATQVRRILKRNGVQSRPTKINEDLENKIAKMYKEGRSSDKIACELNINPTTVLRSLKRNGQKVRTISEAKRVYDINHDFFHEINLEKKAYILGFMYADGNVHSKNSMVKIEVNEKDIDVLVKIQSCIFPSDLPKIGTDRAFYKYITITHKQIKQDLIKHGCVPAKTFKTSMPKLREDLIPHFIRGYVDGDGCIHIDSRVRLIFTGYGPFLKQVKEYFNKIGISSNELSYRGKKGTAELTIGKHDDVYCALNLLYKNSTIYMDRKYKKYLEAVQFLNPKLDLAKNYGSTNIISFNGKKLTANNIEQMRESEKYEAAKFVFDLVRKSGFPYYEYGDSEIIDDFENLKKSTVGLYDNKFHSMSSAGLKIFRRFCKHYYNVCGGDLPSMYEAFYDDRKLMKVIRNRMGIDYKESFNITGNMIRQGFRNSRVAFAASIFKPSLAKFVYDRFAPDNAVVLDTSAGFGQRMLGAMASDKVKRYIAYDPWVDTISALREISKFFDFGERVELCNFGSERIDLAEESVDFVFSSPPFYDKEVYSSSSDQAYQGRGFYDFVDEWWVETAKRVHAAMKPDSLFVLNMNERMADIMLLRVADLFAKEDEYWIDYKRKHLGKDGRDMFFVLRRKS